MVSQNDLDVQTGTVHFTVEPKFLVDTARQMWIEGDGEERAVSLMECVAEDDTDTIIKILSGELTLIELESEGHEQRLTIETDDATEMYGNKLCPLERANYYWRKRAKLEQKIQDFLLGLPIPIPIVEGDLHKHPTLNMVYLAKANYEIAQRMRDELFYAPRFLDLSIGNPKSWIGYKDKDVGDTPTKEWKYGRYREYKRLPIKNVNELVDFFRKITMDFTFTTKFNLITYDYMHIVEQHSIEENKKIMYNYEWDLDKQNREEQIKRIEKVEDEELKEIERATLKEQEDAEIYRRATQQMMERNKRIQEATGINPEKLLNEQMKIMLGQKAVYKGEPDDLSLSSGLIAPNGDWYSCEYMEHEPFAEEYCIAHDIEVTKVSAKDQLVLNEGWATITEMQFMDMGHLVQCDELNPKQKATLIKWLKKYGIESYLTYEGETIKEKRDFYKVEAKK